MKKYGLLFASIVVISGIVLVFSKKSDLPPSVNKIATEEVSSKQATSTEENPAQPKKIMLAGNKPDELLPYATTYKTENFINYGMKPDSTESPTYYYRFNGQIIEVAFSLDGDDKYGYLHFNGKIKPLNASDSINEMGEIEVTTKYNETPRLDAVYIHNQDIVFVWQSFNRYGCCTTPHKRGFLVYNSLLNVKSSKTISYDDGTYQKLSENGFSFVIKDNSLYVVVPGVTKDDSLFLVENGQITEVK